MSIDYRAAMRVRMKRRYKKGIALTAAEFADQEWAKGMLLLREMEGNPQLGLWEFERGRSTRWFGLLWRPRLATCARDTIGFTGYELAGRRLWYQQWDCEVRYG